jgi:hypothetical protein
MGRSNNITEIQRNMLNKASKNATEGSEFRLEKILGRETLRFFR